MALPKQSNKRANENFSLQIKGMRIHTRLPV